jgi:uncharacterized membrane protein
VPPLLSRLSCIISGVSRGRLEAFSDGVLAIVITIMVLNLAPPAGASLGDLLPIWPKFLAYALSFTFIGIYWVNHHHLLQAARTVDGRVLWANMLLLFTLSLVPFGTAWIGETSFAPEPVALYGLIGLLPALAYYLLVRALIAAPGQHEALATAIGADWKGKISPLVYLVSIPIALVAPLVSFAMFVMVAAIWIVPDRRIERQISS